MYGHFLEESDRENLEQSVEWGVQVEAFLDDGDEDVDRDGKAFRPCDRRHSIRQSA